MLHLLLAAAIAAGGLGMMADPIDQLRTEMAAMRAQLGALTQEVVRGSRSRRDGLSPSDAAALLSPRSLSRPVGTRVAGTEPVPDLGSPLMSRLRDDASLSSSAPGSREGDYPNLLSDPLLERLSSAGVLTTSYVTQGAEWDAKYVLNSGTAPVITTDVTSPRGTSGGTVGFEHSALANITMIAPAACDVTVYLRSSDAWDPWEEFLPSFLTAGGRAFVALAGGNVTEVTGFVEIVDGTDAVVAQSDPVDLAQVGAILDSASASAALESPDPDETYRWRLRVDIAVSGADTVAVGIANPILAYSDDGTVPPFSPAVGYFYTPGGATADTTSVVATRVRRTSNQSISDSSDTVVNFETATYDDPGFYDSGTPGRLTVTEDGKYHLTAGVTFAADSGGQQRSIWFIRNGSTGTVYAKARITTPSGAVQNHLQTSIDMNLTAGDYVSVYCHQDSGGLLNVIGGDHNTFFAIHKIGGAQGATGATGATGAAGTVSTGTVVDATLSADQNDWNPAGLSTAGVLRVDATVGATRTVTGLTAQADGTVIWIQNVGVQNLRLSHESASSTAANRFLCYDNIDARLSPNACAWLRYDGTSARWVVLAYPWNPAEDADISEVGLFDATTAAAPDDEFAPAGHVHGTEAFTATLLAAISMRL